MWPVLFLPDRVQPVQFSVEVPRKMLRTVLGGAAFLAASYLITEAITIHAGYDAFNGYPQLPPQKVKLVKKKEQQQDLSKVPGIPGVDYPIYHTVPHTSFSCHNVPALPGMYANVEAGCQAYHVCHDGREGDQGASFLCTNGTLFNQAEFACDWWYKVNCHDAPSLFRLNLDPTKNPYFPKPKTEEQQLLLAKA